MKPIDMNVHMLLQAELYRAYDFLNEHFKLGLKRPVIVIGVENLEKKRGHFSHDIWQHEGKKVDEIMVAGSLLADGAYEAICTINHEMAHQKNHSMKIDDCSDAQRHNKKFQAQAEAQLMSVGHSTTYGFAHTKVTPELRALIDSFKPDHKLFKLFRLHFNELKKRKEKDKEGALKPVMIDQETKTLIEQTSAKLKMTQKQFTQAAAKTYAQLPVRIKAAASKLAAMTDASEIEKYLTELLIEKPAIKPEKPAKEEK